MSSWKFSTFNYKFKFISLRNHSLLKGIKSLAGASVSTSVDHHDVDSNYEDMLELSDNEVNQLKSPDVHLNNDFHTNRHKSLSCVQHRGKK